MKTEKQILNIKESINNWLLIPANWDNSRAKDIKKAEIRLINSILSDELTEEEAVALLPDVRDIEAEINQADPCFEQEYKAEKEV
jgi:hypothetical protein